MVTLIPDPSPKFGSEIYEASRNAISSLELPAGLTRSSSRAGQQTGPSGPAPARASRSVRRAKGKAPTTNGTCGRSSPDLSASAVLQRSLASRLRAVTDVNGSPEYSLTWREWDMPQREPICALRASARRISDSGCSGWATPDANAMNDGETLESWLARAAKLKEKHGNGNGAGMPLAVQALLSGWATPRASDKNGDSIPENQEGGMALHSMAALADWCSPTAQDGSRGSLPPREHDTGVPLSQQAALAGPDSGSSPAATAKRGALNPAHSLWLMLGGMWFQAWHDAGVSALRSFMAAETPSSRKRRQPS